MQGILYIDKPVGWTSFDVVNYVRRMIANAEGKKPKSIKVGHSGTLDPFASGLLILLIGKEYTKQAGALSKLDKTYQVTARLGVTSSTGDPEGVLTTTSKSVPTLENIRECMGKLTGLISQTPPKYSAIKVKGQRAYKLARAGKQVVLEPREVVVHQLILKKYTYPDVILEANVSSGTYIRSLVETLGQMLGIGAYTTTLRRVRIGDFKVALAKKVEDLDIQILGDLLQS